MMAEGYVLTKLLAFMAKIVPDSDGITFSDDGTDLVLHMSAADSLSVTAVLPSGGKKVAPVTLPKQDFQKAYRPGAVLSGSDGKLNMAIHNWKLTLLGAEEPKPPKPTVVDGKKLVIDVAPLKSIPTEDSYGSSIWAVFLPSGLATVCSIYSLVAISMKEDVWPKRAVTIQANAIYPLLNLSDPAVRVNEDAVGVSGKFSVGANKTAEVFVALAKPNTEAPSVEQIESMLPTKETRLSVSASDLLTCIEGAKKTFAEEATNLTFAITTTGLSISLQSQRAALSETIAYVKKPEKLSGKLVINTDVIATAFKGLRELTSGKAIANIRWDNNAIYMRIVEDKRLVGAVVIPSSEE